MAAEELVPIKAVAVSLGGGDHNVEASLGGPCLRIYVGSTGHVAVKWRGSATTVVYNNCPTGLYLDGTFSTVVASGTTASLLVAER